MLPKKEQINKENLKLPIYTISSKFKPFTNCMLQVVKLSTVKKVTILPLTNPGNIILRPGYRDYNS